METTKQVTLNTGDSQISGMEVYKVGKESAKTSKKE